MAAPQFNGTCPFCGSTRGMETYSIPSGLPGYGHAIMIARCDECCAADFIYRADEHLRLTESDQCVIMDALFGDDAIRVTFGGRHRRRTSEDVWQLAPNAAIAAANLSKVTTALVICPSPSTNRAISPVPP